MQSIVSTNMLWRITLALGVIPALGVLYFRRKLPETVRYLGRIDGDTHRFDNALKTITGNNEEINSIKDNTPASIYFKRNWKLFMTAALLWALLDLNMGIKEFGPTLIAKSIGITDPAIYAIVTDLAFALPGAFIGILIIDKSRKITQALSLLSLVTVLILFVFLKDYFSSYLYVLFLVISSYYLVYNIGVHPIIGTEMPAVELSPTKVRGYCSGICGCNSKNRRPHGNINIPISCCKIWNNGCFNTICGYFHCNVNIVYNNNS